MSGADTSSLPIEPINDHKPSETLPVLKVASSSSESATTEAMTTTKSSLNNTVPVKEKIPVIAKTAAKIDLDHTVREIEDTTPGELIKAYHKFDRSDPINGIYSDVNSPLDYNDSEERHFLNPDIETVTSTKHNRVRKINKNTTSDVGDINTAIGDMDSIVNNMNSILDQKKSSASNRHYILDVDEPRHEFSSSPHGNQAIDLKKKYAKKGKVILDFSQGNENAKIIVSLNSGLETVAPIQEKRENIREKSIDENREQQKKSGYTVNAEKRERIMTMDDNYIEENVVIDRFNVKKDSIMENANGKQNDGGNIKQDNGGKILARDRREISLEPTNVLQYEGGATIEEIQKSKGGYIKGLLLKKQITLMRYIISKSVLFCFNPIQTELFAFYQDWGSL